MNKLRSSVTFEGRKMAGARALWFANGMKRSQMGKPVIAVVNSFTQFVPGHVHLHQAGQYVKSVIEEAGCFAAEFNTIAIDDGCSSVPTNTTTPLGLQPFSSPIPTTSSTRLWGGCCARWASETCPLLKPTSMSMLTRCTAPHSDMP